MKHERGKVDCSACRKGYPVACECGGLIHASQGCIIEAVCDKCAPAISTQEKQQPWVVIEKGK